MLEKRIRKASFAGSFYAADPKQLQHDVDKYVSEAGKVDVKGQVRCIIVPHAGHIYSGPVAGFSYRALQASSPSKVFLLGASHNVHIDGMVVSCVDEWETPLGSVKVAETASKMVEREEFCIRSSDVHQVEHSLEVQLPFLQRIYKDKRLEIVPMLISGPGSEEHVNVLDQFLDDNSVLIVSTDLSHYMPYEQAKVTDKRTISAIRSLDAERLSSIGDACGKGAVYVALKLANSRRWGVELLDYRNSGDTAGDKSAVVGYLAAYFYQKQGDE